MTESILIQKNTLQKLENGVWVKADEASRSFIDYSDGDQSENAVYEKVKAAKDRSVFSDDLDQNWSDWALEYHLGSKRSNIYRGLNLKGVKTVLEVGCGCGAITRFLGEQGFQVDAIEGTMRRAEIARLRTEGMNNVQIISSNYHALTLPAASYDLVVFTGVLEYSGAYAPDGVSPETQLKQTLQRAQAALNKTGRVLIAIENRTGFKYLAGASEDHLNVPNIGLHAYAETKSQSITRGIRTWNKGEWQAILKSLDFCAQEFCFPFPDYKVPDAILSDHFLQNAKHPTQVLSGIDSRDYYALWWPEVSESLFWQTAAQNSCLDKFANSFLIVASASQKSINATIDFDFVRFASVRRKLPYGLQIAKLRGKPVVQRSPIGKKSALEDGLVRHKRIVDEKFIDGILLENVWKNSLSILPSYDELASHLKQYSKWLDDLLINNAKDYVDALPRNIVIDSRGEWHLIDQEWRAEKGVSKAVVLFRALFYFALGSPNLLQQLELHSGQQAGKVESKDQDFPFIETLGDFICWGFSTLDLDYSAELQACLQFEERLQDQILKPTFNSKISPVLLQSIHRQALPEADFSGMELNVFWSQLKDDWHVDHSISFRMKNTAKAEQKNNELTFDIRLPLPAMLTTHRYLRIDLPVDVLRVYHGAWRFDGLEINLEREKGGQAQIFQIDNIADLTQRASLKNLRIMQNGALLICSSDAQIVLDLDEIAWGEGVGQIELHLVLSVLSHESMTTVAKVIGRQAANSAYRIQLRQQILERQQQRITQANDNLRALEARAQAAKSQVQQALALPTELAEEDNLKNGGRFDAILSKFGLMRKPRRKPSV